MEHENEDTQYLERKKSMEEFERQLKTILGRYKIEHPGLEAEINRLHREYANSEWSLKYGLYYHEGRAE